MHWIYYSTYIGLACASCSPPSAGISEYYSSDQRTILVLTQEKGYLGQNPAAPHKISNTKELMELLVPLTKLPMSEGSCVAYESFTFAVKARAKAGDFYQCNGVGFRVLSCDSSSPGCRSFVVEARCFDFTAGKCKPQGEAVDLTLSYRYRYHLDKGILWLDVAPGDIRSDVLRLAGGAGFRL